MPLGIHGRCLESEVLEANVLGAVCLWKCAYEEDFCFRKKACRVDCKYAGVSAVKQSLYIFAFYATMHEGSLANSPTGHNTIVPRYLSVSVAYGQ